MFRKAEGRELHFKEHMSGHIAFDHLTDLVTDPVDGTGWVAMAVDLRMHVADVPGFWAGDHKGTLEGDVVCKELGGRCPVQRGTFQLMIPVDDNPRHQHMLYRVEFKDSQGRDLTLNGYKEVITGEFNAFEDTTATLTRIHDGLVGDTDKWSPNAIAAGVLRISALDSFTQLFTFRSAQAGPIRATGTTLRFIGKFTKQLWKVYGFGRRRRISAPA